ncbi:DUF5134 domain-containing protein [Streptomyces acidicola]|uniref:DUF5134 domain-containing protein n=1 Tax=Streptomyces acidicola TaxID=2596892 RepID=UPI00382E69DF
MYGAVPSGWLLVALCAAAGVYCLLRTRSVVEEQRRTAGDEAFMGFGMAAMAAPTAVLALPRWAWLAYAAVFGVAALRALWSARTSPPHLHHSVGVLAMVYMAAVMAAAPAAHGSHGPSGVPLVTGALLLYFTAYVLWAGVRLIPVAAVAGDARSAGTLGWSDRPEVAQACRLSMGIAMLAMLLAL